jgi:hypothetical protein
VPGNQRVDLYCLCWNDARMLPFFFRHYDEFVDNYFVYDNGSTDESLNLLHKHGRVHVTHFDTPGGSFVEEERRLGDTMWKGSDADWVIVTDLDEHIYHPRLLEYLQQCSDEGITAIQCVGYEMVSDDFPPATAKLVESVTIGMRSGCDRLCIFNPKEIAETNFTYGRHEALPTGNVVYPPFSQALPLHYKQLGIDYPVVRSAELRRGLGPRDLEEGWGVHYTWTKKKIRATWQGIRDASGPVPGLGTLSHIELAEYFMDDNIVERSGLFDADWYLADNPDVSEAGVNAFSHYCAYGWREGRKPNFYFDPAWYLANDSSMAASDRNPLCDYLEIDERENARPSPRFDTGWYRAQHGLGPDQSPLQHYFAQRLKGKVSPLPDFDVKKYCKDHPEVLAEGKDPYEHYCSAAEEETDAHPKKRASRKRKRGAAETDAVH